MTLEEFEGGDIEYHNLPFEVEEFDGDDVEDHWKLSLEQYQNLEVAPEPRIGLSFDSYSKARTYYKSYARRQCFAIVVRSSIKRNGQVINITYRCHRYGNPRRTAVIPTKCRLTAKLGCKASMNISLQTDGKWMLNSIELEHNHEMCPDKAKHLKSYWILPQHAKRIIELNCSVGIRLNKTIGSCVIKAGRPENLMWSERDARNYIGQIKRLELQEGEANAMLKYFLNIQADNGRFFYKEDVDEENRLRNIFWADARNIKAFKEYDDVVTFDTTYLVNKHNMPFAQFVGVNHHEQSVLLGCGLLSQEDTDSFVWLFKTWLACMSGCPPNAIITDQCRAMQNAISIVFLDAQYRWCLWHITKKLPEKLNGYNDYELIKREIGNAIYDSLNEEKFEERWAKVISTYHLQNNEWLSGLYDERRRWVPAFVKDTFWAGMSTTQRTESVNAFFDGYVYANTSLKESVEQYEIALGKKVQKEEEEDTRCLHVRYENVTPYGFEIQF